MKIVTQSILIAAAPRAVWEALTSARAGEEWRMADFTTDWRAGSPIEIEARIGARRYRDRGRVLAVEPYARLEYTYWSRVSGLPDRPESYATVAITLEARAGGTVLTVEQQVPPSPERRGEGWAIGAESGWKHVEFYWRTTLPVLKKVVERGP